MPKRQSVKRIKSPVQGNDAWVEFRELKWGEEKELNTERAAHGDDFAALAALTEELLTSHVSAWNWVDDEGADLPLPKDDPKVIELLNDDEVSFLIGHFQPKTSPKA